ncbi:MAG: radical SAM protein, partial [Desulfovibrio sp.]|nr:radical SAM protein [Desulfovibrio sp.]
TQGVRAIGEDASAVGHGVAPARDGEVNALVNAFGQDNAGDKISFAQLLQKIAELPGLFRLRYTSPHPKDMRTEDIKAFHDIPVLCPQLHLPLQSGSTRVLRRMARGYDRQAYLTLVENLKQACPSLALSTDLIVGFPGETEEDVEDTLSMMRACNFVASYSFCYSDRPGARAVTFLDKIDHTIQHARLNAVQNLQEELTTTWLSSRVGTKTTLLLEEKSPRQQGAANSWQGKDPFGTTVHVQLPKIEDYTGKIVEVTIHASGKHCLLAQQTGRIW